MNLSRPEWHPVPLDFEAVELVPGLPLGHTLAIVGVQRDDHGIRINYEIVPPLPPLAHGPRGEARNDHDQEYDDVGGAFGRAPSGDRTDGVLTMPLPQNEASVLDVRMSWSHEATSLWKQPSLRANSGSHSV